MPHARRKAAELSLQPQALYLDLANAELGRQHPREALAAFDKVLRFDIRSNNTTPEVAEINVRIAEGRARAWMQLGDNQRAVEFEVAAVTLIPENRNSWIDLATLYKSLGRTPDAEKALQRAQQLAPQHPAIIQYVMESNGIAVSEKALRLHRLGSEVHNPVTLRWYVTESKRKRTKYAGEKTGPHLAPLKSHP